MSEAIILGRVRLGYSGIRIYSGVYYGYSAPGSRIDGMELQVFRNKNSSQTNAYSHYSNYSYSGLIPNERTLNHEPKIGRKIRTFSLSRKNSVLI